MSVKQKKQSSISAFLNYKHNCKMKGTKNAQKSVFNQGIEHVTLGLQNQDSANSAGVLEFGDTRKGHDTRV